MREFISCTIQYNLFIRGLLKVKNCFANFYPKKRKNSIGVDQDSLNSLSNHHKGTWDV